MIACDSRREPLALNGVAHSCPVAVLTRCHRSPQAAMWTLTTADQITLHLFQPHQADQMLTPPEGPLYVDTC